MFILVMVLLRVFTADCFSRCRSLRPSTIVRSRYTSWIICAKNLRIVLTFVRSNLHLLRRVKNLQVEDKSSSFFDTYSTRLDGRVKSVHFEVNKT